MNRLFRNIPLPVQLLLLGLLPLFFICYLAYEVNREKTEKVDMLDGFLYQVSQANAFLQVIDNMQVERRLSLVFTIKNTQSGAMTVQREKTDQAIEQLVRETRNSHPGIVDYTYLSRLDSIRRRVDLRSISAPELMDYYTTAIFRINTMGNAIAGRSALLTPVASSLTTQRIFSEMITYLGINRATVYTSLATNTRKEYLALEVGRITDLYLSFEKELYKRSSPYAIASYDSLKRMPQTQQSLGLLERIITNNPGALEMDAEQWWQITGQHVDALRMLQKNLLRDATAKVSQNLEQEREKRNVNLILLLVVIALMLSMMIYTVRHISRTLRQLGQAARHIASGQTNISLPPAPANDVVRSLVRSISLIDESNNQLAHAADAIGQGNFDVSIQPRSKQDILVNALQRMRNDLQLFAQENERKIWIQTAMVQVGESLRGEKQPEQLSQDILNTLVESLNASVGVLYLSNTVDSLRYAAGYAVPPHSKLPPTLAYGQTLLGQAAQSRKLMDLPGLPEHFIRISTASGESSPRHIIVVPFVYDGLVEGVAELGLLEAPTDAARDMLIQSGPQIAQALQGAKNRARLRELLAETQAQSEELQAQHSELENINAELDAQAQKLQASEEELKVQQEELLQTNQELEENTRALEEKNQLIVERNLEIQRKAEELALSTKYKSEFLANMSHELRTPLNSILLLSRLMAENNEQNLSSEQVEYARVIQSSGNGLLALIDEILDLSKIEAGKMELEYNQLHLPDLLDNLRDLFLPLARQKNLELDIQMDAAVHPVLETDRMRLDQILKNLLSNAIKFTAKGKVSLRVQQGNNGFLQFAVSDTGIGIPADKQKVVFEAFQQADGSTRRKYGGTGLGLSISRELARLLGGDISLNSEPGQGSTFILQLPDTKAGADKARQQQEEALSPLLPEPVTGIQEVSEPAEPETGQKRYRTTEIPEPVADDRKVLKPGEKCILIIEDDTPFAQSLLQFTHKQGYKGIVAVRGDEGIELARQYKPTGILLDIQLPVKDGWEVMAALKQDPETRHIPVHIMSSLEARQESLLKGAVDFINKPMAFEQVQDIFKKIEYVLQHKSRKVLIVEENTRHARALANFLETFDVKSEISGTVPEGIDALQQEDVDCVILDMGIPDQKAYDTLEEVKKNKALEKVPIIIFTGKSLSRHEEQRIRKYADSIVVKTAHSYQRILDEVSLFLHLVSENDHKDPQQKRIRHLGSVSEVLAHKTVLVADDDVRNIYSLTRALENLNMNVIPAMDGKEALQKLEENPQVDVVLMDMMMPGLDGYETTAAIRNMPRYRNLPIIAVTAKAMTGDRQKCINAGASDYITKPVDLDQLLSLLRVWLYDRSM